MRILMAAGGTGGHVFPALAIAHAFQSRNQHVDILFVGTPRGMENEIVPKAGFSLELINIAGLKGKGWIHRLRTLATLPRAFFASWKLLRRFKPDAVFGIGGYASGPILLTAALTGRRTAILEPNAIAGFSNRVLGKFVDRVFIAFQEAHRFFSRSKVLHSGNPIRKEILQVHPPSFEGTPFTVLVFGGSQGAQTINEAVIAALPKLKESGLGFFFIHQTGIQDEPRVKAAFAENQIPADVFSFSEKQLAKAYERCHLVIARGGSSVLEIAACGRPSIIVPYPLAADDHQRANAKVMSQAGASIYVENQDLSGHWLANQLILLAQDKETLRSMSEKALGLRYEDAAERIAKDIEERVA